MAVFKPNASTRNGRQVDENPSPVRPLMNPAKAKPKVGGDGQKGRAKSKRDQEILKVKKE